MADSSEQERNQRALEIFEAYLERLEAQQAEPLEEFLENHPELRTELARLAREHEELFDDGPRTPSNEETSDAEADDAIDPAETPSLQLLNRLEDRKGNSRYKLLGEVARGGMGAVLRVRDEDLNRNLAMKVVLGKAPRSGDTPEADPKTLARFLEEAQITGQLDHPGIVPVHELGLDPGGRAYFTMKLVKGEDFSKIIEKVHGPDESWTLTRALNVLLKVCEAMSYAHAKGVIHRDLKPANIMVGRFEEVHVMDWGLARVLGEKDTHDLRIADVADTRSFDTARHQEREQRPDTPLVTMDGTIVGTPAYMPPEQARGELAEVDRRSDVYALGSVLYHLLTGQVPFVPRGARVSPRTILIRVLDGPPKAVHQLAPVPAELEAICDKAMARRPAERYASTAELAEDLRDFLEERVVQAYRTGALVELRKWIRRNRTTAVFGGIATVAILAGLISSWILFINAARSRRAAEENERTAVWNEYVASIRAANVAVEAERFDEARRFLEACPSAHRSWEWGHLSLWCDRSTATLSGHDDRSVTSVAFAPGSRTAASAGSDGNVQIWDLQTKEPVTNIEIDIDQHLRELAYSPAGNRLAVSSGDTVQVWDTSTLELLFTLKGHAEQVTSLDISSDGRQLVSGSEDLSARLWNLENGTLLDTFWHDAVVTAVRFSESHQIATGSSNGGVTLWDTRGERLWTAAPSDNGMTPITDLAFDPQGSHLAASGNATTEAVHLLSISSGAVLLALQVDREPTSLAYTPDGRRLAIGTWDEIIEVWDPRAGQRLGLLAGHTGPVWSVAYSKDGKHLASGSEDGTLRLWSGVSGDPRTALVPPSTTSRAVEFYADFAQTYTLSPDASLLALHDFGNTTAVWRLPSGAFAGLYSIDDANLDSMDGASVLEVAIDQSNNLLAQAMSDGTVQIWKVESQEVAATLPCNSDVYTALAVPSDGKRIAVTDASFLSMWSIEDGSQIYRVQHPAHVDAVALDDEGRYVATSCADFSIRLWDYDGGALIAQLKGHTDNTYALSFDPSGRFLASGSMDGTIRLWDLASYECKSLLTLGRREAVLSLAFNRDGSRIASSSSEDASVVIWATREGDALLRLKSITKDHRELYLRFDPRGRRLVADPYDAQVVAFDSRLEDATESWNTADNWRLIDRAIDELFAEHLTSNEVQRAISNGQHRLPEHLLATTKRLVMLAGDPTAVWFCSRAEEIANPEMKGWGEPRLGIALARASIRLAPNDAWNHRTLAQLLFKSKLYDDAVETIRVGAELAKKEGWDWSEEVERMLRAAPTR